MSWLGVLPAFAGAAAIIVAPGLLIGWVLRLRGLVLWSSSAPISATVIAASALWAPLLGVRWSLVPVVTTVAAVAVVGVLVRLVFRRHFTGLRESPIDHAASKVQISALVLAAVLIAVQLVIVIGEPRNISQTFDNVFHLNAVRFILDTGSASPLTVGNMTSSTGGVPFYPDVWHAVVALVVQISGETIPTATNAMTLAVAVLVWPATVAMLTRCVTPISRSVIVSGALLAAACAAFPLQMIDYGVLYPYFFAVALLPAALAATLRLLSLAPRGGESSLQLILLLVGTLPGLLVTHPGAFVAWLFAAALAAVWAWCLYARSGVSRRAITTWGLVLVAFAAAAFIAWRILRPPFEARGWPIERTVAQAMGEVLFQGMNGAALSPVLVLLLASGVVVLWRSRSTSARLALALFAVFGALYVVAAALPWQHLRDLLTAAWYNNSPRLAALLPVLVVPIAAAGSAYLYGLLHDAIRRRNAHGKSVVLLPAAAILSLVVTLPFLGVTNEMRLAHGIYSLSDSSPLLSSDEYTLLERLPENVPVGAVIAGSPWTGTALAYAIGDRDVVMRHILTDVSEADTVVNDKLDEALTDPDVCPALEQTGVRFVLDFGTREVHGAHHAFVGLEDLVSRGVARVVDSQGDAKLYKITACGLGS